MLLEAFQKQALEAERRHLLDFTAVPNDISHELNIDRVSMRGWNFAIAFESLRLGQRMVPQTLKTENILPSGNKWGEVKAVLYHNGTPSEPNLGLVIAPLTSSNPGSLKANQELITMNIISATTIGRQITKAYRPCSGSTVYLCSLKEITDGDFMLNDCLTIKLSVFATLGRR